MEKDLTSSITVTKRIWLCVQHPSSEVLGTLEAPGELCLCHRPAVEEAASAGRQLRAQGKESPSPCPELPFPQHGSGKPLPDATGFVTQLFGLHCRPAGTSPLAAARGRAAHPAGSQLRRQTGHTVGQVWQRQQQLQRLGPVNGVIAPLCLAI